MWEGIQDGEQFLAQPNLDYYEAVYRQVFSPELLVSHPVHLRQLWRIQNGNTTVPGFLLHL